MSVAHLTYVDGSEYQIELRMFIDDLIIGTGGKLPMDPTPWSEVAPASRKVKKYLENHFKIKINDLDCVLTFQRMEVEQIAVVAYLSLQGPNLPTDIETVEAINSILVDDFENQRNIVHIELPKTARKSLLFNAHEREAKAVIKQ